MLPRLLHLCAWILSSTHQDSESFESRINVSTRRCVSYINVYGFFLKIIKRCSLYLLVWIIIIRMRSSPNVLIKWKKSRFDLDFGVLFVFFLDPVIPASWDDTRPRPIAAKTFLDDSGLMEPQSSIHTPRRCTTLPKTVTQLFQTRPQELVHINVVLSEPRMLHVAP